MAKQAGMGDNWYFGGSDLSGDCQSLVIHGGSAAQQDTTDITQSGFSRLALARDGGMAFVVYFDPTVAHPVLSALPTADVISSYFRGTATGVPACSQVSKQVGYDPSRAQDGSLTLATQALANGSGQEWGVTLTPGIRTYGGGNQFGPSIDTVAPLSFGAQAYLHVVGFTGTDATVKIQDSADNSAWADVAGMAFTQTTAIGSQRIAVINTATIREWVRAAVTTVGGYTNLQFALNFVKNSLAGQVF